MVPKFSRAIVPVTMALVLVAAVAHVASSNSGGFGGHMGRHGMHGGMDALGVPLPLLLKSANLTDAQKQQIHQIFESRHTARKAEIEQLKAAKEQIAAKYTSTGAVTASDLSGPVQQLTQLQAQMTNEQIQDAIAVRNVLTPAQLQQVAQTKTKLDQIHSEMHALFESSQSSATPSTPTE
jgi:Spy/CpxP family protein refolding chaperone